MFAKILRDLRKTNRLTQGELARALNVSTSTIGMYERGERMPPPDMLLAIADYFGTDVNTLLGVKAAERIESYYRNFQNPDAKSPARSEDEEMLIRLFRTVPEEDRQLVLQMIRAALSSKGLL